MTGQEDFLAAVRELEELAQTREGSLTMQDIEGYFSDMALSEAQLDQICRYLNLKGFQVEGQKEPETDVTEDNDQINDEDDPYYEDLMDDEMVRIYKKEASRAKSLSEDQENQLVYKLAAGDQNARNLLIEANLGFAIEMAERYKGRGLLLADLIQESNIGLMMAINSFEPEVDGRFALFKEEMIRNQIEMAIEEYSHSTRSARKIASRINELNGLSAQFAREYEREATPAELAERMGISEDEVLTLMKTSLDAIAVLDQGKIGK